MKDTETRVLNLIKQGVSDLSNIWARLRDVPKNTLIILLDELENEGKIKSESVPN